METKDLETALLLSFIVGIIGFSISTPKPGLAWVLPLWIILTGLGFVIVKFMPENRGKKNE